MTTPEEFKSKTTESLEYLDSILPEGSGVVVTGLAQGQGCKMDCENCNNCELRLRKKKQFRK